MVFSGGIGHVQISNVAKTSFPSVTLLGMSQLPSIQVNEQTAYEPPLTGHADLSVVNVTAYPLPLDQGGDTLIEVTVTNLGNVPTQNGFFTDLYLDHLPTGVGDHNNLHLWVADSIGVGETVNLTTTLSALSASQNGLLPSKTTAAPSTISQSSGILYSQTDSTGIVSELDNENNIYSAGQNSALRVKTLLKAIIR